MEWQTKVTINAPAHLLSYANRFFLCGSCFATGAARRLQDWEFHVATSPFGILFNPASIAMALERLECKQLFSPEDVLPTSAGKVSFWHHSSYAKETEDLFLKNANEELIKASDAFASADTVILTLGTSWAYRLKETGITVANCHKLSSEMFDRYFLSPQDTFLLLERIIVRHPKVAWIITVSPVRHLADGAHENQISKAALLMAVDALTKKYGNVMYYPAYEILLDELRDYRFYASDWTHPSDEAESYIWQRFLEVFFDPMTQELVTKVARVKRSMAHKLMHPASEEAQNFEKKRNQEWAQILKTLGNMRK